MVARGLKDAFSNRSLITKSITFKHHIKPKIANRIFWVPASIIFEKNCNTFINFENGEPTDPNLRDSTSGIAFFYDWCQRNLEFRPGELFQYPEKKEVCSFHSLFFYVVCAVGHRKTRE